MSGSGKTVPGPQPSGTKPTVSKKDYIKLVLLEYEDDTNYPEAVKEHEELLSTKDYGISTPGPVVPFKEEKVTNEQKEYKPNLAEILLKACNARVKNYSLAWREYIDLIEKHKVAVCQQEALKVSHPPHNEPSEGPGEKGNESNQETKGSDIVDSPQTPDKSAPPTGQEQKPLEVGVQEPVKAAPPQGGTAKQGQNEQGKTLTLFELLEKEKDKESEEYEEAYQDLVHMFTCQAVLRSSFPQANVLQQVTVNMSKPDEVPDTVRERALYRYLVKVKPETYDGSYNDIWREYGTLLIAENLLDLARKANGPDRNIYVIVEKRQFYTMQTELKKKTEEVEELSTRLSRFASQQLTEGNPNIADLSDVHRPTRLGEMYSQLFDDEWSEAFEALKPTTKEDEDEIYPNTLTLLQKIVKEVFSFCKEKSQEQLQRLENHMIDALKQDSAQNPETKLVDEEEKMEVDQKPDEGGEGKVEGGESGEKSKSPLHQVVERHAKELRKAASRETAKLQAQVFIQQKLCELLPDEKVRQDERVVTYVSKCVELCWYMCMQDPPMELVFPQKGETMDKNLFSHHGRKGKVVDICVWAALLLHKEGPVVCKGYILPEEKKVK
ncbi:uncharacterized protein LOC133174180 isoform X2 [Saccostrea echinata]|uniref:uncharacterized protein LOC133174180 isoform X2 n=1 Tax=Saccostrea echinata TaxID=191078 RepID=UPI002A7F010D|nr:uncharacterized protein LOC133174180 isoform X2 [Saccostrea echinata]